MHHPLPPAPFEDQSPGSVLRLLYEQNAAELVALRARTEHDKDSAARLAELEDLFVEPKPGDSGDAAVTGDPVIDRIERQIAAGQEPDLEDL